MQFHKASSILAIFDHRREHKHTPPIVNTYLQRHGWSGPEIKESAIPDLTVVVVIPAFNEIDIIPVLTDLRDCYPTKGGVEILVVINHPENAAPEVIDVNDHAFRSLTDWISQQQDVHRHYHLIYKKDLPAKKAGVGLARKIGMDEAVRRFDQIHHPAGIIVCLDADCHVDRNYLSEIERFFSSSPKIEGCSIAFSHSMDGLDAQERHAILDYERHLRYFVGMQRWAGCLFAFQTIGSCMAVRAGVYCKVGGMNTRQAGEDFYFLHKVIKRGFFAELNTTIVHPSARISDRVPFGTGRAMMTLQGSGERLKTYHPQTFIDLKVFLNLVPELYTHTGDPWEFLRRLSISRGLTHFLQENHFDRKLAEIQTHTASPEAFIKRFFHWFDAFMLMKYVHFMRDRYYGNVGIDEVREY